MKRGDPTAPTLDYASPPAPRPPLRERIDLQFWLVLGVLIGLLLLDLSCIVIVSLRVD